MTTFTILFSQALVEFFGTLSKEWALDCMKELLTVNLHGNLQIVVQVHSVSPMSCPHISWCVIGVYQELPADTVLFPSSSEI